MSFFYSLPYTRLELDDFTHFGLDGMPSNWIAQEPLAKMSSRESKKFHHSASSPSLPLVTCATPSRPNSDCGSATSNQCSTLGDSYHSTDEEYKSQFDWDSSDDEDEDFQPRKKRSAVRKTLITRPSFLRFSSADRLASVSSVSDLEPQDAPLPTPAKKRVSRLSIFAPSAWRLTMAGMSPPAISTSDAATVNSTHTQPTIAEEEHQSPQPKRPRRRSSINALNAFIGRRKPSGNFF